MAATRILHMGEWWMDAGVMTYASSFNEKVSDGGGQQVYALANRRRPPPSAPPKSQGRYSSCPQRQSKNRDALNKGGNGHQGDQNGNQPK